MWKAIGKIDNMFKHFEDLSPEDKQLLGFMAGMNTSLFLRGIINSRRKTETIKLVVPKNAEVFIFVKGGK